MRPNATKSCGRNCSGRVPLCACLVQVQTTKGRFPCRRTSRSSALVHSAVVSKTATAGRSDPSVLGPEGFGVREARWNLWSS